jgi:hypothetical protein
MSAWVGSATPSARRRVVVDGPDDRSNDYQRQPAASVIAIDARSAMARVKRARFAFTIMSLI